MRSLNVANVALTGLIGETNEHVYSNGVCGKPIRTLPPVSNISRKDMSNAGEEDLPRHRQNMQPEDRFEV
jgi:hypothetical protein